MPEHLDQQLHSNNLSMSFVPSLIREGIFTGSDHLLNSEITFRSASLLWIDVVHFSTMCNRLMKDTVGGVEKLTGILQAHYDYILDVIVRHGGSPLFFAGDGLMSVWTSEEEPVKALELAVACGHELLARRSAKDDQGELISLHAIIANGSLVVTELEGLKGKKLSSFSGESFQRLTRTSRNRSVNHLLISDRALSMLRPGLRSTPVEYESSILLDAPQGIVLPEVVAIVATPESMKRVQAYVPTTLGLSLDRDRLKWIAEIRPVTIVFVRVFNSGASSSQHMMNFREAVSIAVSMVEKYEGLINQVWLDEKDSNMLICFGPSPSSHVDNPERGVKLAFELSQLLKKHDLNNSIGVCTGMAHCGILGNDHLRQYTVLGDVVNLSSRLTGIRPGTVFCDKTTHSSTYRSVGYEGHELVVVKGLPDPIPVYIPRCIIDEKFRKSATLVSIGREKEISALQQALRKSTEGKPQVVLVEGENGMGKTMLLTDFMQQTPEGLYTMLRGTAEFSARKTPYQAIQQIMEMLLGITSNASETDSGETERVLQEKFGTQASLFNIIFKTSIPDSEQVRNLTGSQRVQATQDFLISLLYNESRKLPLVIIVDDAQWIDEPTWKLLESLRQKDMNLTVILSATKLEGIPQLQQLADNGAVRLVLGELTEQDIERLISAKLGGVKVEEDVLELIRRVSKGNPHFCIEFTGSLIDQELLSIEQDICKFKSNVSVNKLSLPESVRGAIRSRIDRLGQGSQLSLKVGSVIGNRFAETILTSIYPIASERGSVSGYLEEVEQYGFLNETMVDNMNGYLFNNATIVEVAYEMTLSEQRRQLHRESAEWYEKNFADNLKPFYLRLAQHWNNANEKEKAAYYYEMESMRIFQLGFATEALDVGLKGVEMLGFSLPREIPNIGQQIAENFGVINELMQGRTIAELAGQKKLQDPNLGRVIKLLLTLVPVAHQCQQGELFALMAIICQRLTLENGNGESAAEVYSMFSIIYKALTGDSQTAFAWSELALEVDRLNGHTLQARVTFVHCWFIALWILPLKDLIAQAEEGAKAGFSKDDVIWACFNLSLDVVLKSVSGKPLTEVVQTAEENFVKNNRAVMNAGFHLIHEEQVAKAFMGKTDSYTSLTDVKYDEQRDIASICNTDLYNQIAYYLISKMKLNAHFGNWAEAVAWGEKAFPLLPAFQSQPGQIELEQFYCISSLYGSKELKGEAADNLYHAASASIEKLRSWADLCPENFLHKLLMLEAIRDGMNGDVTGAEHKFLEAANRAEQAGYIQDQALAFEHMARLEKSLGKDFTQALNQAKGAYRKWNAEAKIEYLDRVFA